MQTKGDGENLSLTSLERGARNYLSRVEILFNFSANLLRLEYYKMSGGRGNLRELVVITLIKPFLGKQLRIIGGSSGGFM